MFYSVDGGCFPSRKQKKTAGSHNIWNCPRVDAHIFAHHKQEHWVFRIQPDLLTVHGMVLNSDHMEQCNIG